MPNDSDLIGVVKAQVQLRFVCLRIHVLSCNRNIGCELSRFFFPGSLPCAKSLVSPKITLGFVWEKKLHWT